MAKWIKGFQTHFPECIEEVSEWNTPNLAPAGPRFLHPAVEQGAYPAKNRPQQAARRGRGFKLADTYLMHCTARQELHDFQAPVSDYEETM